MEKHHEPPTARKPEPEPNSTTLPLTPTSATSAMKKSGDIIPPRRRHHRHTDAAWNKKPPGEDTPPANPSYAAKRRRANTRPHKAVALSRAEEGEVNRTKEEFIPPRRRLHQADATGNPSSTVEKRRRATPKTKKPIYSQTAIPRFSSISGAGEAAGEKGNRRNRRRHPLSPTNRPLPPEATVARGKGKRFRKPSLVIS